MNFIAICLFLSFQFVDGGECSFPADGLSMTVEGKTLVVSSTEMTATLQLSDLASMRFTDSGESAVANVEDLSEFEVFSLKGESKGSFKTVYELKKSLPGGVYILRRGDYSIKISI